MITRSRYIKVEFNGIPSQDQDELELFISDAPDKMTPVVKNNEVVTYETKYGNKYYIELVNDTITVTQMDRIEETKDLKISLLDDTFYSYFSS